MNKVWFFGGAAAAVVATVVACSSSSNNGTGTNSSAYNCISQASGSTPNSTCESCVNSNCGSQVSSVESACSAFISCICPNGTFSATAAQGCEAQDTSACNTAGQAVSTCEQQNCATQCAAGTSSSSGSSSGTSSSGTSSGTATATCSGATSPALTGDCLSYCNCCYNAAAGSSTTQSECVSAAQGVQGADPAECTVALAAEQDAGLCH